MGINDVYDTLKGFNDNNPTEWFSSEDIKEELRRKGVSEPSVKKTTHHLFKLAMFKMVDMKGHGVVHHIKLFRIHTNKRNKK